MMKQGPGARGQGPAKEKGFALLFVFLMAAIVALYLYAQLPRVAFESERDKEQLLIDRGEQYKRAIQLYVIAVKKYPQKIEDLENTNEKRYLRQRYIDPMTGKDEWRIIHVNAAGVLTDSLVQKPPDANANGQAGATGASGSLGTSTAATFASPTGNAPGVNGATGATGPPDPNDVNAAVRRRPSDLVGQAYTAPANADPNDPSTWAPISLTPAGANGASGAPTGQPPSGAVGFNAGLLGQAMPGQPGQNPGQQPGQPFTGQLPGQNPGQPGGAAGGFPLPGQPGFNPTQNQFKIDANGQLVPIQPTQTGAVINSQTGGVQNTPAPAQQPAGINAPGMSPGNSVGAQNAATAAINNMLTNPNPAAGANGLGTAGGTTQGGIAGVASMYKGTSIKIYGTRQKYQEWEFIFSMNNQQNGTGQNRNPLTPGQNGLTPGQTPGQNGAGNPPPIGSTTGTSGTGN